MVKEPENLGISIVTAHYNHGDLIERCVKSTAHQKVPVYEHIIVDDGSAADHKDVLKDIEARFSHVRVVFKPQNEGAPKAFSDGVAQAKGSHVLVMSADDYLADDFVAKYMTVLRDHPDAALVTSDPTFRDEKTQKTWQRSLINVKDTIFLSPQEVVSIQRRGYYFLNGTNTVVRTDLMQKGEIGDDKLRWHHDWFTLFVIAYRFGVWYVPTASNIISVQNGTYSTGAMDWSRQREVLSHLFTLLESKAYGDVRDQFIRSDVLIFFPYAFKFLCTRKAPKGYLSARFLAKSLFIHCKRRFIHKAPWIEKLFTRYVRTEFS
ncbi:glycosyltransferase family 2 protein [Terasakiella pusilla]|uniref:glycosyltransferase family 2 protein n=1 Tax=Terasakiella pusilla TaxID=64973 RepID=UPI003AA88AE9